MLDENIVPINPLVARDRLEYLTGERWSLDRLAFEMGASSSASRKWSSGKRNPSIRSCRDAARLLALYESKFEEAIA